MSTNVPVGHCIFGELELSHGVAGLESLLKGVGCQRKLSHDHKKKAKQQKHACNHLALAFLILPSSESFLSETRPKPLWQRWVKGAGQDWQP